MRRQVHLCGVLLVATSCATSTSPTRIVLEVSYDTRLAPTDFDVSLGAGASTKTRRLPASSRVVLVVGDSLADRPQELGLVALRGATRAATGRTTVTPVLGREVVARVTLARVACGEWCAKGATECRPSGTGSNAGTSVVVCEQRDDDSCMEWSEPVGCGVATPQCALGTCVATCVDECAAGETQCAGGAAVRMCGQRDSDTCLEWLAPTTCNGAERCSSGACRATCEHECEAGALKCLGAGRSECGDLDGDGCREWSPTIPCAAGAICQTSGAQAGACSVRAGDVRARLTSLVVSTTDVLPLAPVFAPEETAYGVGLPLSERGVFVVARVADPSRTRIELNSASLDSGSSRGVEVLGSTATLTIDAIDRADEIVRTRYSVRVARASRTWVETTFIKASDAAPNARGFGRSLALSADGNVLAVERTTPHRVYMFARSGESSWREVCAIPLSYEPNDRQRMGISGDGRVVVLTAPGYASSEERAYVYERGNSCWELSATLRPPANSWLFGQSVSISEDGTAIALAADVSPADRRVYVFRRGSSRAAEEVSPCAASGVGGVPGAVALARDSNSIVCGTAGSVWLSSNRDSTWVGDAFGTIGGARDYEAHAEMAASGDLGVVARALRQISGADASLVPGLVCILNRRASPSRLEQFSCLPQDYQSRPSDPGYGSGVAISNDGSTLVVGSPGERSGTSGIDPIENTDGLRSGAVYIHATSTLARLAMIKASNAREGASFGHAVALSADGRTLAVGALYEANSATGINPPLGAYDATGRGGGGAVYVFESR